MLEDHRSLPYWKCFACRHPPVTFPASELLLAHIKELHSVAISEDQLSTIVEICQQNDHPVFEKCPLCSWADEQALREHMLEEHKATADANGPVYWECLACRERQTFDDHNDLDEHTRECHRDTTQRQTRQGLQCAPCQVPAFFIDEDDLRKHLDQFHPGIDAEDRLPELVDMCGIGASVAARKSCPFCRRPGDTTAERHIQPDQSILLDHIAQHTHLFSLLALPWATEPNEDGSKAVGHPIEQFDVGEYFADDDEGSQHAQVDGRAGSEPVTD